MKRIICVLLAMFLCSFMSVAKKIPVEIELNSGKKIKADMKGLTHDLISPYAKFYSTEGKHKLSDVKKITILNSQTEFVVKKVQIFEDTSVIAVKEKSKGLFYGLVNYRPCTCKDSYRTSEGYVFQKKDHYSVVIKHFLKDKVIKKRGEYLGLSDEMKTSLAPLNFRFSAVPEVYAQSNK